MNTEITAQGWFALGNRVPYDRSARSILRQCETTDSPDVVHVFQREITDGAPGEQAVWTTFLPGFPGGTFGWANTGLISGLPVGHLTTSEQPELLAQIIEDLEPKA